MKKIEGTRNGLNKNNDTFPTPCNKRVFSYDGVFSAGNKKAPLKSEAFKYGTRGRTRTDTLVKARDFESLVSTNFTTLAMWGAL